MLFYIIILNMKLNSIFMMLIVIVVIIFTTVTISQFKWKHQQKRPILLWWTPFFHQTTNRNVQCDGMTYQCISTENRAYQNDAQVIIFYGSSFNQYDVPLPRKRSDLWAIIHEESPKNLALFLHEDAQNLFNFTSTFSRSSHFPLTLQYLPNLHVLVDEKYFRKTDEKNQLLKHLSPVLYVQSDCVTPLERDSYVNELMKYIPIDSYGKCLNNKQLPKKLARNPLRNLYSDEFMHFVGQYKFVISFENAICDDYITEKLWRPLIVGSVPIYMGSPTVQDWIPNNKSIIMASHFTSPKHLANYIGQVNSNDQLYESFLQHKLTGHIENIRLKKTLAARDWSTTDEDDDKPHFFESFECFICKSIHNRNGEEKEKSNSYNCPEPVSPLTGQRNQTNWWLNHWIEGKWQAIILRKFVSEMNNFTRDMFDEQVRKLSENI